jgi:hypothetical protein
VGRRAIDLLHSSGQVVDSAGVLAACSDGSAVVTGEQPVVPAEPTAVPEVAPAAPVVEAPVQDAGTTVAN